MKSDGCEPWPSTPRSSSSKKTGRECSGDCRKEVRRHPNGAGPGARGEEREGVPSGLLCAGGAHPGCERGYRHSAIHPSGRARSGQRTDRAQGRCQPYLRRRPAADEGIYGIGFTQALSRLRSADDADALGAEISTVMAKQRAPRWLEELASTFLTDAGAQTSEGTRTTSIPPPIRRRRRAGLPRHRNRDRCRRSSTPLGLIQQVRLGLSYSLDARRATTLCRTPERKAAGSWTRVRRRQ